MCVLLRVVSLCFIKSNCQPEQNSVGDDRWWHTLVFLLDSTCPRIYWEAQKLRGTQNPRHYIIWRVSSAQAHMLAELVFIAVLPVVAKTSYRCGLDPDILPPNWGCDKGLPCVDALSLGLRSKPRLSSRDLAESSESCGTLWNLWTVGSVTVGKSVPNFDTLLATFRTLEISRNRSFMLLIYMEKTSSYHRFELCKPPPTNPKTTRRW